MYRRHDYGHRAGDDPGRPETPLDCQGIPAGDGLFQINHIAEPDPFFNYHARFITALQVLIQV